MSDDTVLATLFKNRKRKDITINEYNKWVKSKDKEKIAEMIYHRFYGRYLKPYDFPDDVYEDQYKNGFVVMASACLLIETFVSFRKGWEETQDRGDKIFNIFFNENSNLRQLGGENFYKHIRCGILHQAETTGGFKIWKVGPLYDTETKTINALKFMNQLEIILKQYKKEFKKSEWDSEIWDNLRRKMRFIIKNCEVR